MLHFVAFKLNLFGRGSGQSRGGDSTSSRNGDVPHLLRAGVILIGIIELIFGVPKFETSGRKQGPNQVHGSGGQRPTTNAKEQSTNNAHDIHGAIANRGADGGIEIERVGFRGIGIVGGGFASAIEDDGLVETARVGFGGVVEAVDLGDEEGEVLVGIGARVLVEGEIGVLIRWKIRSGGGGDEEDGFAWSCGGGN